LVLFEKSSDKYLIFPFMPQSSNFQDAINLKNCIAHILMKNMQKIF